MHLSKYQRDAHAWIRVQKFQLPFVPPDEVDPKEEEEFKLISTDFRRHRDEACELFEINHVTNFKYSAHQLRWSQPTNVWAQLALPEVLRQHERLNPEKIEKVSTERQRWPPSKNQEISESGQESTRRCSEFDGKPNQDLRKSNERDQDQVDRFGVQAPAKSSRSWSASGVPEIFAGAQRTFSRFWYADLVCFQSE